MWATMEDVHARPLDPLFRPCALSCPSLRQIFNDHHHRQDAFLIVVLSYVQDG